MKTTILNNKRKQKRLQRVIPAYLKHKGQIADVYRFTTELHAVPSYRIAGLNIAIQRGEYLGKDCLFYSLVCFTT
jgi:hypothetical protein